MNRTAPDVTHPWPYLFPGVAEFLFPGAAEFCLLAEDQPATVADLELGVRVTAATLVSTNRSMANTATGFLVKHA